MSKKIKVVALKDFCTYDAEGVHKAKKGDKLTLHEYLAVQLAKAGFVRKERKK